MSPANRSNSLATSRRCSVFWSPRHISSALSSCRRVGAGWREGPDGIGQRGHSWLRRRRQAGRESHPAPVAPHLVYKVWPVNIGDRCRAHKAHTQAGVGAEQGHGSGPGLVVAAAARAWRAGSWLAAATPPLGAPSDGRTGSAAGNSLRCAHAELLMPRRASHPPLLHELLVLQASACSSKLLARRCVLLSIASVPSCAGCRSLDLD